MNQDTHGRMSPVLSLTILDRGTLIGGGVAPDSRVLVVVRDPTTNLTHPSVVSVPTQRMPGVLFQAILETSGIIDVADSRKVLGGGEVSSMRQAGHEPLIYSVESLLARKLELSAPLETGALSFLAAPRGLLNGVVEYDNMSGSERKEQISMLNVAVYITAGAELMPKRTSSYSYVSWAPVQTFIDTVEQKSPSLLDPVLDPFEYCVHGLCVAGATEFLSRALLRLARESTRTP